MRFILEFVSEFGVVGDLEGAHPMRLKPLPRPDASHRGPADPHCRGHRWGAPVGRLMGRRLVGQRPHPIDGRGRPRRKPRRPGLVTGQPCDPFVHAALLPAPDHRLALAERPGDGVSAEASAVSKTIRARQTCFCGRLRSRMIASSRTRATGVTVIDIPLRIRHARTNPSPAKYPSGVFRQVLSTRG